MTTNFGIQLLPPTFQVASADEVDPAAERPVRQYLVIRVRGKHCGKGFRRKGRRIAVAAHQIPIQRRSDYTIVSDPICRAKAIAVANSLNAFNQLPLLNPKLVH